MAKIPDHLFGVKVGAKSTCVEFANFLIIVSSLRRSFSARRRRLDRLLFGGLVDLRAELTPDLSHSAVSGSTCLAVASVAAMTSGTGIVCGVTAKLRPRARTRFSSSITSCAIVIVQLCNQLMKIFGSKRPGILLLLSATKKFINSFHLTRVAMNVYDSIYV